MQKPRTVIRTFTPRLTDLVFVAVFALVLRLGAQMLSIDSDLGRHLTLGNYILENRFIPTRDLFSHTLPGQHRPPYEWLTQILFAFAENALGLDGVILLTSIVVAITFTLLFYFTNQRTRSPLLTLLFTFLAVGASSLHWLPRPHIVTILFLAIWVEKLEQIRQGKPIRSYTLPLIMLFWVNMHGGFIFGILAWLAYMAGWLWDKHRGKATAQIGKQLLIAGSISLITTIVTPDLWHNWEAVLNNRSTFILSRTVETMPPNLLETSTLPFTLLLVLTFIFFVINHKTLPPGHFLLLTGLGGMSLLMTRNIPLFVIACTPIVSGLAKTSLTRSNTWTNIEGKFAGFGRQAGWSIIPLLVILVTIGYFSKQQQPIFQFNPRVFPVQAIDWLEANPQSGNMFNEFNWGGYILYRTWPRQRVFLDSQSDFYGEPLMRGYEQIISARGDWENLLEKYRVGWVIIPVDSPLAISLSKSLGWKIVYQDETAIIINKTR